MTTTTRESRTDGHTPGPWTLPHFARPNVGCSCGYVLADGYMGAVATVHCSGEGDGSDWRQGDNPKFDEAVANAHLIAAAPDMLAALKKARQFIANGVELGFIRMPDISTLDPAHETLPTIEAAISAAEGTQP